MTCERVELELVAYHFGTCMNESRTEVEAHLLGCTDCLQNFLALKRGIETGESAPRPSEAARARLRVAVRDHLRRPIRQWRWWERPFAFSLAGAVVVMSVLTVHAVATGPGNAPRTRLEPRPSTTQTR